MPVENCWIAWTKVAKWKVIIMGTDRPWGSCVNKALYCKIFIAGYWQFVEQEHLFAALCSAGYRATAVARKLYRWLSMSGIATPLKNGSVRPSGDFQGDGSDVWPGRGICWASSCLALSLQIIRLLWVRWAQSISESPSHIFHKPCTKI